MPKELNNAKSLEKIDNENNDLSVDPSSEELNNDQSLEVIAKENNSLSREPKLKVVLAQQPPNLNNSSEFPEQLTFVGLADDLIKSYNKTYECAEAEFENNTTNKSSLIAFVNKLNHTAKTCAQLPNKTKEYERTTSKDNYDVRHSTTNSKGLENIEKERDTNNQERRKLAKDVDELESSLQPLIPTISQRFAFAAERFIRAVAEVLPQFHYPVKLATYGLRTFFGTTILAPNGSKTPAPTPVATPKGTLTFFQSARFFTDLCNKEITNSNTACNTAEKANPDLKGDLGFFHKITNWW